MRATVIRTDANDLFGGLKGPIVGPGVWGASGAGVAGAGDGRCAARKAEPGRGKGVRANVVAPVEERAGCKGAWPWSDFDLDPWETKDSAFYGAALAALATGLAPAEYQARPEIQENVAALRSYLRDGAEDDATA